jgi:hypothetical protein
MARHCWIAKGYRDRDHNRGLVMRTHTGKSNGLMKYDSSKEEDKHGHQRGCFGYCHLWSRDIGRPHGNCGALRLPFHIYGAKVPTVINSI